MAATWILVARDLGFRGLGFRVSWGGPLGLKDLGLKFGAYVLGFKFRILDPRV